MANLSALLPGFTRRRVQAGEMALHVAVGGDGPPVVLLHGYPQTHVAWHAVAPRLAERFTVVCPDLRGYGASDKPPGDPDHQRYAKRAMAGDVAALMAALGHARFAVVGHDRGALAVWRRWAGDVDGRSLPCGHFLAEERPDEVVEALRGFLA